MKNARDFVDMNADEVFELKMLLIKAESSLSALKHTNPEMYEACTLEEDIVEQLKSARKKIAHAHSFTFDTFNSYKYLSE